MIPQRRHTKGPRPGVSGGEAGSGKSDHNDCQWIFPIKEPSQQDKRKLLGLALEIGVKAAFNLHCYQFGGNMYKQSFGGPIGMRLTMSVSRIVMADWSLKAQKVFRDAGIKVYLATSYVDDVKIVIQRLPAGWYFDKKSVSLKYDKIKYEPNITPDKIYNQQESCDEKGNTCISKQTILTSNSFSNNDNIAQVEPAAVEEGSGPEDDNSEGHDHSDKPSSPSLDKLEEVQSQTTVCQLVMSNLNPDIESDNCGIISKTDSGCIAENPWY